MPRSRSATVIELAGRHEYSPPTYPRRLNVEPRLETLHWLIGLVVVVSFLGAVAALLAA